ncbi:MAG: nucleotide exchange factor GrpE [Lentisphaeria bacterium]|nr:nucleotide exchange factor GrpE [Lentisphaeria bacterium]
MNTGIHFQNMKKKKKRETAPETAHEEDGKVGGGAQEPATPDKEADPADIEETPPDYKALCSEANDRFLRSKAELDNYRKRMQRELAEARAYTKMITAQEFLSVYDHFQMAMMHADVDDGGGMLKQGMLMISNEFGRTLENLGVSQTENAVGCPFNPDEHEAVGQEPSDDVPEGTVIGQWKVGFRMGDRLIRPASVIVSSGPSAPETEGGSDTEGHSGETSKSDAAES